MSRLVRGDRGTRWLAASPAGVGPTVAEKASACTRRVPFFRSHPSLPLTLAAFGVLTVGVLLPATPLAAALGFAPLPLDYFAALGGGWSSDTSS